MHAGVRGPPGATKTGAVELKICANV